MNKMIDNIPIRSCVGCGFCCIKTPCDAARRIYGSVKECPDLIWNKDENRYICRLMTLDGELGIKYRLELYAGEGCCCGLNSWRNEVKPRRGRDLPQPTRYKMDVPFSTFVRALSREFISKDDVYLSLMRMKSELEKNGFCEDEIESIIKEFIYHFNENISSQMSEFMG